MNPIDRLRDANPVPDEALDTYSYQHAEDTLKEILNEESPAAATSGRRLRKMPALVAACALAATALTVTAMLPSNSNEARDVLLASAEAANAQPDLVELATTGRDYVLRTDSRGQTRVRTEYVIDASGDVHMEQQVEPAAGSGDSAELLKELGDLSPAISAEQFATTPGSTQEMGRLITETYGDASARSLLKTLLTPGIRGIQEKAIYELLASLDGNDLAQKNGEILSIIREEDELSFDILATTGQLIRTYGLMGADITTSVETATILDCNAVTGLAGPDQISLGCADNNHYVDRLTWQNWGGDQAKATGTSVSNSCDPSCAEGNYQEYPVVVTAREKKTCGYQVDVYTILDIEYQGKNAPAKESVEIGCFDETTGAP
ncbi:hypothetical protein ACFLIN_04325 [Corynebacterium kutscheri]|uniref:Tat pathway signal sequence domain protein n=1 Tax=Corynebacterium kutscheri TaxID=35755 RepID=A0AB38VRY1_9CORY|nr:hypothetical protein [Corynebacterium kutscheri]VEH05730.1 Uncharacterised protein [Corynebacterium kutscheri]